MSELRTVWDAKGELFEVSPTKALQLLAAGWTNTPPAADVPVVDEDVDEVDTDLQSSKRRRKIGDE